MVHDNIIKWKHFPRYCPFVRGIHRSSLNSNHKGQWRGALIFSFFLIQTETSWIFLWTHKRKFVENKFNLHDNASSYIHLSGCHYNDFIMTTMASQITSRTVVYSTVYSDADQRKHQSSVSLAFVWGIHRDRWIPRTKGQLRGKCFHLMTSSWNHTNQCTCLIGQGWKISGYTQCTTFFFVWLSRCPLVLKINIWAQTVSHF